MEQPNSENIGLQLRNALFGSPGTPINQGAVDFGRRILPMLGINSFPKDNASTAEPKLLGTTAMTEIRPDETTLSGRAEVRTRYEGTKQQQNLENISFGATPFIKEDAKPNDVEEDWLANFFDRGRLVSDEEMQKLWSHILASEVNQPGSFSSRTVNLLASISKKEASLFKKICSYIWVDAEANSDEIRSIIITNKMTNNPTRYGLSIADLYLLQDTGLIIFADSDEQFALLGDEQGRVPFEYYGNKFEVKSKSNDKNVVLSEISIGTGYARLTSSGEELSRICSSEPDFDYMNHIIRFWKKQDFHVKSL